MVSQSQRAVFDQLLETILDELPDHLRDLLDEVPLIVEDEPAASLLEEMGLDPADTELCGLHSGIALTERTVEAPAGYPDHLMVFRGPILRLSRWTPGRSQRELRHQIRVTVLHEIGHHFGLDEDALDALGYG